MKYFLFIVICFNLFAQDYVSVDVMRGDRKVLYWTVTTDYSAYEVEMVVKTTSDPAGNRLIQRQNASAGGDSSQIYVTDDTIQVTIDAASTTNWVARNYAYDIVVRGGGDTTTIFIGSFSVLQDVSSPTDGVPTIYPIYIQALDTPAYSPSLLIGQDADNGWDVVSEQAFRDSLSLSAVIDVVNYAPEGTLRDKTVDWSDYFNLALATGKSVYAGYGEYLVKNVDLDNEGQRIIGEQNTLFDDDVSATKFYPANDTDTMFIYSGVYRNGIEFCNINGIDVSDNDTANIGIYINNGSDHFVRDCTLENFISEDTSYAIYNNSAFSVLIDHNIFNKNQYSYKGIEGTQASNFVFNRFLGVRIRAVDISLASGLNFFGNAWELNDNGVDYDCMLALHNVRDATVHPVYIEMNASDMDTTSSGYVFARISNDFPQAAGEYHFTRSDIVFRGTTYKGAYHIFDISGMNGVGSITVENVTMTTPKEGIFTSLNNPWVHTYVRNSYMRERNNTAANAAYWYIRELIDLQNYPLGNIAQGEYGTTFKLHNADRTTVPKIFGTKEEFYDNHPVGKVTFYNPEYGDYFDHVGVYNSVATDGNDTLYIPTSTEYDTWADSTEPFTIVLWANTDGLEDGGSILHRDDGTYLRQLFYITAPSPFRLAWRERSAFTYADSLGGQSKTKTKVMDGEWHCYAMVKDSANTDNILYTDGLPRDTSNYTQADAGADTAYYFMLGIEGRLFTVAFYDIALTAAQVDSIYNGGAPPDLQSYPSSITSNLVEYFLFDTLSTSATQDTIIGKVAQTPMILGGNPANPQASGKPSIISSDPTDATIISSITASDNKTQPLVLRKDGHIKAKDINFTTLPTDSTGLDTGDLFYLSADGIIRRKY